MSFLAAATAIQAGLSAVDAIDKGIKRAQQAKLDNQKSKVDANIDRVQSAASKALQNATTYANTAKTKKGRLAALNTVANSNATLEKAGDARRIANERYTQASNRIQNKFLGMG